MNTDINMPQTHRTFAPLSIILAILAILALMFSTREQGDNVIYGVMRSTVEMVAPTMIDTKGGAAYPTMAPPSGPGYYPMPYSQNGSVTDTREFNKLYYNAMLKTRDVQSLTRRVETTVRGYNGRVDGTSSAAKYGYVSFVVPAAKFDQFRSEIENLVGSRFLTVTTSSQNLLPQKQSIEEQQKQASATLAAYQASRQKLVATHTAAVQALQGEQDKQQLASENSSYASNLAAIDAQIAYANKVLTAVKTQDKNLLDEVATVNGTISLNWISWWDSLQLYIPGPWIAALLAIAAVISEWWHRRRRGV